ncbi:LysM peptidoglycan-binding domain-containing protein [Ureibacillus sp. FSL K6-8385]|uniref:LysM peptidoglycan-binding domain-containing protein n=1 Tax=Ureibacillus terrenus TaxID=118246 RepID=A0A540V6R2_9BACL|nr:LysM peptidoglycan-binding domain-containing protein [Ureibacillus terrenus]MED3660521.1 LysM peptidoglycan-binding domain-containing protein [Ureibacillus terrenus]MED3762674.1 LysM peptidoglycan-binding domain-containing protein [Ureibacillus terrenus]TQE92449.1 LysM peptidoglycan-binding domain-containing protein [Ureibacillus terrenus]
MRWLREKQYIMILGIVSLLIIAYIIITDEGDISYEPITVKEGDTLWTLADRYK